MIPFRFVFRHPTVTALAGSAMIGWCIVSYELFPDKAQSPKETVVQDTMMYVGMPLAIVGGGVAAIKSHRKSARIFSGLISSAASVLAFLTFATYRDRPR